MPKSTSQPDAGRLTDRKRAAIIQAAVEEFQGRGYFSTSMAVIADTANVSKRTLYNHFASKEALFEAILEALASSCDDLPSCTFDPSRDLDAQLIELARSEVELMTSDALHALARAGISRILAEPDVGKQIDHRRCHRRVEDWLDQAQASGALRKLDTPFAAQQFVGLLLTFAFWPSIVSGQSKPTSEAKSLIIDSSVAMFLNTYRSDAGR